jgi:hypothetical protein
MQLLRKRKEKEVSNNNYCSNGETISIQKISTELSKAYARQDMEDPRGRCECCDVSNWEHHDHTISQRVCKILHKAELVFDPNNWSRSCSRCHHEWESYKSGLFRNHKNYVIRMLYLRKHDPESYRKRLYA